MPLTTDRKNTKSLKIVTSEWETTAFILNFLHFNKHRRKSIEIVKEAKKQIENKQSEEESDAEDGSGNEIRTDGENVAYNERTISESVNKQQVQHKHELEQLSLF